MNNEAYKKIQRARIQLTLDKRLVFFASLVLRLKVVEDKSVPTACVNNKEMRYNPDFVMAVPPDQMITLIAHETMHPALGHPWRLDGRDHELFNVAADYAINQTLYDEGLAHLDGWLQDNKYRGMSAERIYTLLQEENDEQQQQQKQQAANSAGEVTEPSADTDTDSSKSDSGSDSPDNTADSTVPGDVPDAEPPIDLDSSSGEDEWKAAVAEAAQAAKSAGAMSAGLARLADDVVDTRVNWRAELQQFMQQTAQADYTWYRPSVRYMPRGLFMPSLRSEQMPPIVVGIDTSGSVSARELGAYAAEINAAVDAVSPERVYVIHCDSRVRHVEEFEAGEQVELHPRGGGGTRFSPVMDWVRENGIEPAAMIYFTDLWSNDFGAEPDYPVLWLTTDKHRQAPYGTTIPMLEV